MRTFKKDYKINFIDDNNVFVGFDDESCCCEQFGYFLSRTLPTQIEENEATIDTEGFNFDPEFFQTLELNQELHDEGGIAIFRLTKGAEEIFLALYNSHNGYYSHGFDMTVGGIKIHDGSL